MLTPDDDWLVSIVRLLDRLRSVPNSMLAEIVTCNGACMWVVTDREPPSVTSHHQADRELATLLCLGCLVQAECLELELRTAGEQTTGVWGALSEDDRRALYSLWLEMRRHVKETDYRDDAEGGPTP